MVGTATRDRQSPAFEETHRVLLFDHVGCGKADSSAYDPELHASLQGYADDVIAIARAAGATHGRLPRSGIRP